MSFFEKKRDPFFLKESTNLAVQIEQLKAIQPKLNEEGQSILAQDLKYLESGQYGEDSVEFELRNSHLPIIVLRDVYLEYEGLSAQIDYMVFTRKVCFVIECKNLYGDIEITNQGQFIRTIKFGNKTIKEGIYSPITQNKRHLDLIRKIVEERQTNFIMRKLVEKSFDSVWKPVVVLANNKTVLKNRYAPSSIKNGVIRLDQLIDYIRKIDNEASNDQKSSYDRTRELAQSYLNRHQEKEYDYTSKYQAYMNTESAEVPIEETPLYNELRKYRLERSRSENIKPYYVFNNKQLISIIELMPKSPDDLLKVNGLNDKHVEKYGHDIIEIIQKG